MIKNLKAKKDATQKGFTLIEILVYIALLVIIVTAISTFLFWAIKMNSKARVTRETLDSAKRAMEIMTHEIREAENIYEPTTIFDSNPGQLSLKTNKYLPADESNTYVDFFVSDGRLGIKKESQSTVYLTSSQVEIQNLVFRKIVSNQIPSVQIELTIAYKNPSARPEYNSRINLQSTASLRK